ncbi:MAG: erythromycin esterase [Acidobacteria bacterium]|nr:MAG: erythromycin esterase [Acidobacteriota bacterium]PYX48646.1 MAG: erythromycin esterase [Acidobacteriota bacterium]
MELVGNSRFTLLGEASHGTHDFYHTRAQITQWLIKEKGYSAVAVEADWPDAHRVNRYVQGRSDDADAVEALGSFKRFPTWMWRNTDVVEFVAWLREYNDDLPEGSRKVGFYGLDLYSLHASARAVLDFLDKVDPEAAQRARYRYACFEHFGEDTQAYGYAARFGLSKSCEDEVVNQLVEMQKRAADLANRDGHLDPDAFFIAEQNARLVANAERYYRSMFESQIGSWNLRDQHMVETLDALVNHLGARSAKVALWAHNSHLGDARATQMGASGELNVGQLVRQRHGEDTVLVGFTTHTGTVTAASNWDGPAERKRVRAALSGSYESLFHAAGVSNFLLILRGATWLSGVLNQEMLERAIGVIYLPESERVSHYFQARLANQFDAVIHLDETRAVEPLERTSQWEAGEFPETYPFAV